jgi:hypothetical protein
MSKERAAWSTKFLNALADGMKPEEAAKILLAVFRAKQSWAVLEVLERLVGKVSQPIEGPGGGSIRIEVVHLKGEGGNGNGGNGGEAK